MRDAFRYRFCFVLFCSDKHSVIIIVRIEFTYCLMFLVSNSESYMKTMMNFWRKEKSIISCEMSGYK